MKMKRTDFRNISYRVKFETDLKGGNHLHRTEHVELTVLCMVERDGKYLLQNRVKADWQGYALPGGHVEPGESIVHAVVREMREETGLTVLRPRLCGVKQFPIEGGRYLVFLFRADDFTGTLCSSDEGEMHWVEKGRLSEIDAVDDLALLISMMQDDALTEFQYVVENDEWRAVIQ